MHISAVLFEYCVFGDHTGHDFTICGKNFLWVELHRNDMAQNTLESRSYAHTLSVTFAEHSFMKIYEYSNGTAIHCKMDDRCRACLYMLYMSNPNNKLPYPVFLTQGRKAERGTLLP